MNFGRSSALASLLAAAVGCAAAATTESVTLYHQGSERSYLVHRPPQHASGTPLPLLIALHGTTMRSADMLAYTDLPALADRAGVVLIAPSSLGDAFNDGLARAGSEAAAVDDVGFVEAVAEDARLRFGVRAEAIHLVGFSNGGSMVQRVAIESSYPFAGFAAVASAVRVPTAGVLRPAPMLLVFGNADPLNPPGGGWVWIPVPHAKPAPAQTARQWSERLRCDGAPETETPAAGVLARHWRQCAAGARLAWLTIDGLGHHWAGARPMPFPSLIIGPQVAAPPLGELVWQFLSASTR